MATSPSDAASRPMSAVPETTAADAVVPAEDLMKVGSMPFFLKYPSTSATAIGRLTNEPARVTTLTFPGAAGSAAPVSPEEPPPQPASRTAAIATTATGSPARPHAGD